MLVAHRDVRVPKARLVLFYYKLNEPQAHLLVPAAFFIFNGKDINFVRIKGEQS